MKNLFKNRLISKLVVLSMLLAMTVWTVNVSATTPTTPTIDGTITTDWDANENLGPSGPSGIGDPHLWLTWDANNLYIGIEGDPDLAIQIFLDVAADGATRDTNNNYDIASVGGYEYTWRVPQEANHTAPNERWFTYSIGNPPPGWGTGVIASSVGITSGYGDDLEIAIPWTALGFSAPPDPNTRLGILVTFGPNLATGSVSHYWPDVAGNDDTIPSFTQQFIFDEAGADGVTTGNSPTAVSLANISITNSGLSSLWLGLGLLILLTLAVFWRQLRSAKIRSL